MQDSANILKYGVTKENQGVRNSPVLCDLEYREGSAPKDRLVSAESVEQML